MQLIHQTTLSVDDYINTSAWQETRLECCPHSKKTTCRLHRHGSYARKSPRNVRIARYYCRTCQMTFSLLPSFMAAGKPGTLQAIEDAVLATEECANLRTAHDRIHPIHHGTKRAQRRWLNRRIHWVALALHLAQGLFAELYAGAPMTVRDFRARGATTTLLMTLRKHALNHLQASPKPVGFNSCGGPVESQTGPPTQGGPC